MNSRLDYVGLAVSCLAVLHAAIVAAADPAKSPVKRDRVKGASHADREFDRIHGKVRVLNANTLEYEDGTVIELYIVVPNRDQCAMKGDLLYPCGVQATNFLEELIGDRPVSCFRVAERDGPWWGFVENTSLEQQMVINGWALATQRDLEPCETIAREHRRGLWRGKFVPIDDWDAGVRLEGESPPPKLTNEAEANDLLLRYGYRRDACATLVTRIANDLPDIKRLVFPRDNQLTDAGLEKLTQLGALEHLDISHSGRISDDGLSAVAKLPHLRHLMPPHSISDEGMVHVAKVANLQSLYLGPNAPLTEKGMALLRNKKTLRRLTLHFELTDDGMKHLAPLTELTELILYAGHTPITDVGMGYIRDLRQLRRLTLVDVQMTDKGLEHIQHLSNLVWLDFGGIRLTDAGLVHITKLHNLEYLDVSDTKITDQLVKQFADLTKLRLLAIPDEITVETRNLLIARNPRLKFDGRPEEVLLNRLPK